jgi:hypothetical protein
VRHLPGQHGGQHEPAPADEDQQPADERDQEIDPGRAVDAAADAVNEAPGGGRQRNGVARGVSARAKTNGSGIQLRSRTASD